MFLWMPKLNAIILTYYSDKKSDSEHERGYYQYFQKLEGYGVKRMICQNEYSKEYCNYRFI